MYISDFPIYSNMSSSNNQQRHRSASSFRSRPTANEEHMQINRSRSASNRQVIIILTNDPDLLRHTRHLQPQVNISLLNVNFLLCDLYVYLF